MSNKQKTPRAGKPVKKKDMKDMNIKNITILESAHGNIRELRKYKNNKYGAFFHNGQFRWVSIISDKKTSKVTSNCKKKGCDCGCGKGTCTCKKKKGKCGCGKGICACNMTGGGTKSIDLKTAVKLLRNYYSQKYN